MSVPLARRGASLVEMLAAMSVGALLLSLAAAVIVMMLRWDSAVLRRTAEERARSQLAGALRDDARAATQPPRLPASGTSELQLDLGRGRRVEYRCRPGWVDRRIQGPRGVESAEAFRLAPQAAALFRLAEEHDRSFLRLDVAEPAPGGVPTRQYELWAALPPRDAGAPASGEQP